jgi:hypothetical protein
MQAYREVFFYERVKPQQGITYFICGGAGSLRVGDIRPI